MKMIKTLNLKSQFPRLEVKSLTRDEIEIIRLWKNKNREFFFFSDEISKDMQLNWFESYQTRIDDFMFVIWLDEQPLGVIGLRDIDGIWDIYNVIRGNDTLKGSGYMHKALRIIIDFALEKNDKPITLKVLKNNPAVAWYLRNGFEVRKELENSLNLIFTL